MTPTESDDQSAIVAWWRLQYPSIWIFAIPNGAFLFGADWQRGRQMARLKREGLTPGIPDLLIPEFLTWIEVKREKGGVVSVEQSTAHNYLRGIGHTVIVGRGFDDTQAQLVARFGKAA